MLTKSAAKAFFLGGTALCGAAFILLTLDTLAELPKRSHQENMTPEVVHGHQIWRKNNCMGCHTLMGEGAYYAPELTKVVERRGAGWIDTFLQDPAAFYPGRRRMVKYDIFDNDKVGEAEATQNRSDVIAFFDWVGKINTNGFPHEPDMKATGTANVDPTIMARAPKFFQQICAGCHSVGGKGGNVGPALDGVPTRFDREYLTKWVADPQSIKPDTIMPNNHLEGPALTEIIDFLETL